MPEGYRLVDATEKFVLIQDTGQPDLLLQAELDEDGNLIFSVQAEDLDTGRRGSVQGWVLFDLMIRHFGRGVRCITAWWPKGTNHAMFHRLLSEGATIHEAASNTWTAQQARCHGFLAVIVSLWTATSPEGSVEVQFFRTEVVG